MVYKGCSKTVENLRRNIQAEIDNIPVGCRGGIVVNDADYSPEEAQVLGNVNACTAWRRSKYLVSQKSFREVGGRGRGKVSP
ncbi:hypothetical protein TNCV_4883441 [Trichonephila clavipes]|nr:hypothetical protein TNCV_4883441 [Trichonephila clavipes]